MRPRLFSTVSLLTLLLAFRAGAQDLAATTAPIKNTALITLHGEIDDYSRDHFIRNVQQAQARGATILIIDIDTYGGLVTSGMDLSRFIKNLPADLHTIAYVDNKAISAGAMIAMACDEIVMARSATLGDCAPIVYSDHGLESLPTAERAKMESPIVQDFRESAAKNHHDPLLAEAMVSVQVVVHWVQSPNGKQRRFVDDKEYERLADKGWTIVADLPDPIDSERTLLTVTTDHAIALGLASGEADSVDVLAESRGLSIADRYRPGFGSDLIEWLNNSYVRGVLLAIFLTALYAALHAPGHGAAEVIAFISLGLLLVVPLMTGYAEWWQILAVLLGLSLLAIEIFVYPTVGLLAVVGIVLILGGLVLTFVGREPGGIPGFWPKLPSTWTSLQRGLIVVSTGMACSFLLSMWLRRFLPKMPYFNRLILSTTNGPTASLSPPQFAWPEIGMAGRAITDLRPSGSAAFSDDLTGQTRVTAVVSDSGYISQGEEVIVYEVGGNRVVVRRLS